MWERGHQRCVLALQWLSYTQLWLRLTPSQIPFICFLASFHHRAMNATARHKQTPRHVTSSVSASDWEFLRFSSLPNVLQFFSFSNLPVFCHFTTSPYFQFLQFFNFYNFLISPVFPISLTPPPSPFLQFSIFSHFQRCFISSAATQRSSVNRNHIKQPYCH